ncbi:hypothetical protein EVAR_55357_1 [Eumeta japonica]|uniref:Uncharacterized protein n=1 Tax=Eumeta variegata TaxID=151549 RepID=A0A4C1YXB6_EUMVA|nr:hypothetical protein EVAR_55357_1 [Eumeta japonica]
MIPRLTLINRFNLLVRHDLLRPLPRATALYHSPYTLHVVTKPRSRDRAALTITANNLIAHWMSRNEWDVFIRRRRNHGRPRALAG